MISIDLDLYSSQADEN